MKLVFQHVRCFYVVPDSRFGKIQLTTSAQVVRSLSLAASTVRTCYDMSYIAQKRVVSHQFGQRPIPGCLPRCYAISLPVVSDSLRFLRIMNDPVDSNTELVGLPAAEEFMSTVNGS